MKLALSVLFFALGTFAAEPSAAESAAIPETSADSSVESPEIPTVALDTSRASAVVPDTTNDKTDAASAEEEPAVQEPRKNIPLPRQTAYIGQGLSVGIAAGVYEPTLDCDCMGIWQVQVEFFYSDWISGGGDVRYFGGTLDKSSMLMYQRYRLNARFHKKWETLDVYAEPVFGFETTSISEFRDQVGDDESTDRTPEPLTECEKMFSLDGFSVGLGGGAGWKPFSFLGFTGSVMLEYGFSKSLLLSITPGLAFNVMDFWPWGRKNLRSIWISAEFGTQRYFNRGVSDWSMHGILGIQLAI